MFGRSISLFRLFGFEVKIDASWLIIAFLIVWSLAVGLFPSNFPELPRASYWWMGVFGAIGLFASIVFHEFCHSLVARRLGLPMKGITLFVFGGVAEMEREPPSPKVEFLMAIAGPISSVVLGFIFRAVARTNQAMWPVAVTAVLAYLSWINWILAGFNMIPAFPLDGGRVLRSALWHWQGDLRRATRIASFCGSSFGTILIILGFFQLFSGNFISAVWTALIGLFLRSASLGSYQQVLARSVLEGQPVRRFMTTNPITVPADISIQNLVDDYIYRYHHKLFPVVADSTGMVGCVTLDQVKQLPRQEWDGHQVAEIAKPCSAQNTIGADVDAAELLSTMNQTGRSRFVVLDNDKSLAGIVSSKDLARFLSLKLDLEDKHKKAA